MGFDVDNHNRAAPRRMRTRFGLSLPRCRMLEGCASVSSAEVRRWRRCRLISRIAFELPGYLNEFCCHLPEPLLVSGIIRALSNNVQFMGERTELSRDGHRHGRSQIKAAGPHWRMLLHFGQEGEMPDADRAIA